MFKISYLISIFLPLIIIYFLVKNRNSIGKYLQVLDHPNITKFYDVYKTKKGSLHIVMEYADDHDLESKIKGK